VSVLTKRFDLGPQLERIITGFEGCTLGERTHNEQDSTECMSTWAQYGLG